MRSRSLSLRSKLGVNAHHDVVHKAVAHSPDYEFLIGPDAQLVLYAVEIVPDRHCAVAPRLGDLGVRPAASKWRQGLPLQRRQFAQGLAGLERCFRCSPRPRARGSGRRSTGRRGDLIELLRVGALGALDSTVQFGRARPCRPTSAAYRPSPYPSPPSGTFSSMRRLRWPVSSRRTSPKAGSPLPYC